MWILERGETPKEQVYRCRCRHCKTLFEFSKDEADIAVDVRDGDYLAIDCPICRKPCIVPY